MSLVHTYTYETIVTIKVMTTRITFKGYCMTLCSSFPFSPLHSKAITKLFYATFD